MTCTHLHLAAVVAAAGLLAMAIALCIAFRRIRQLSSPRTASGAQIDREVRRIRAGQTPPPFAPDPRLTTCRSAAIEHEARAAARGDFKAHHRRGNPYPRKTREYSCWAHHYCDEWNQLAIPQPSLDTSEDAAHPPTPPHPYGPGAA